ncbi:MAG: copper chaperone PCu(A)C [Proteobacteria bacterium]|nr:copper chaperone PCu(A)C [Pseudomonadota bacterium]
MKTKIALLLTALCALSSTAFAEKARMNENQKIQIVDPWIQPTTNENALLFGKIANSSPQSDELIAVATNSSVRNELHAPEVDNSITHIKIVSFIPIPPHGNAVLAPNGHRIMLKQINRPLSPGDSVEVTFTFKNAGNVQYLVPVRSR